MSSFGDRLKSLREDAGLTQVDLAVKAGMHRFGIAKLEQGVREPSWATVQSLAKALGVSCSAFEVAEGESPPEVIKAGPGRPRKAKPNTAATAPPTFEKATGKGQAKP